MYEKKMTKNDKLLQAKVIFEQGYNCCQAVFVPFAMEQGIEKEAAFKLSSGFAAGMCYLGETCGAVVGAQMAIGLNFGYANQDDQNGREHVKKMISEYRKNFNSKNGAIRCKELLGADPSSEKGLEFLRENDVFKKKCPGFVADSVEIIQSLLNE